MSPMLTPAPRLMTVARSLADEDRGPDGSVPSANRSALRQLGWLPVWLLSWLSIGGNKYESLVIPVELMGIEPTTPACKAGDNRP